MSAIVAEEAGPDVRGPFLFLEHDEDGRATATYCTDRYALIEAVLRSMFFEPDPEHHIEARAVVDELIAKGVITFEGDPPLSIERLTGPVNPSPWESK